MPDEPKMGLDNTNDPESGKVSEPNQTDSDPLLGKGEGGKSDDDPLLSDKGNTEGSEGKDKSSDWEPYTLKDLDLPEDVEVPEDVATLFLETAKELKLEKDGAKKLLQVGLKHVERAVEIAERKNEEAFEALKAKWFETLENDPVYGGPKLQETIQSARNVLTKHADKELVEDLKMFGFTHHGGFIKFLAKLGKLAKEDKLLEGGSAKPKEPLAVRLFPSMKRE